MLTSRDQVIVTNNEEQPLRWRLDGRPYVVPPGATVHIPFDLVKINLGDPRSGEQPRIAMDGNEKIRLPSRADEIKRLEGYYGISGGIIEALRNGTTAPTLVDKAPSVTVTDQEGNKIHTVIDDPGGDNPEPIPVSLDTPEALAAQVAQQQKTLDMLLEKQRAHDASQNPDGEPGDDVEEDKPNA